MTGRAQRATAGAHGFDINQPVSAALAATMYAADYRFVLRYVRRDRASSGDVSAGEVATLHANLLSVGIVQHFGPADGWAPTDALGVMYGANAVAACRSIGVPVGVTVWLDLEGVAPATDPETIIRYCNRWFDVVDAAGFEPGLYVGYGAGLTPSQLYRRLKFRIYFGAYNLNRDQFPAVRGLAIKQRAAQAGDMPRGYPALSIDVDDVQPDVLGGLPTFWVPS